MRSSQYRQRPSLSSTVSASSSVSESSREGAGAPFQKSPKPFRRSKELQQLLPRNGSTSTPTRSGRQSGSTFHPESPISVTIGQLYPVVTDLNDWDLKSSHRFMIPPRCCNPNGAAGTGAGVGTHSEGTVSRLRPSRNVRGNVKLGDCDLCCCCQGNSPCVCLVRTDVNDLSRGTPRFARTPESVIDVSSVDSVRKDALASWNSTALQSPRSSNSGESTTRSHYGNSADNDDDHDSYRQPPRYPGATWPGRRREQAPKDRGHKRRPTQMLHSRNHSEEASLVLLQANVNSTCDEREECSTKETLNPPSLRFDDLYVLTRLIFQCEQSSVWECVHRSSGERYCVKVMDDSSWMMESNGQREASMLQAAQSHSHILGLVQVIQEDTPPPEQQSPSSRRTSRTGKSSSMNDGKSRPGKLYLVTEWMSGGNLLSFVVQNGRLDEATVQRIAMQLLQAVDHLHTVSHMSHNDLHPANILLGRQEASSSASSQSLFCWDTVKVADFGAATALAVSSDAASCSVDIAAHSLSFEDESSAVSQPSTPQHRSRLVTLATPHTTHPISYRAPELKHRNCASAASDMWSIGAIVQFCLAGQVTEDSDSPISSPRSSSPTAHHHQQQHWSRLSRHAKQFLSGLLDDDPSVRMTACEALQHPWLASVSSYSVPRSNSVASHCSTEVSPPPCAISLNPYALGNKVSRALRTKMPWTKVTHLAECLHGCWLLQGKTRSGQRGGSRSRAPSTTSRAVSATASEQPKMFAPMDKPIKSYCCG